MQQRWFQNTAEQQDRTQRAETHAVLQVPVGRPTELHLKMPLAREQQLEEEPAEEEGAEPETDADDMDDVD
eukprot:2073839-Rhodomonas_salina.1